MRINIKYKAIQVVKGLFVQLYTYKHIHLLIRFRIFKLLYYTYIKLRIDNLQLIIIQLLASYLSFTIYIIYIIYII